MLLVGFFADFAGRYTAIFTNVEVTCFIAHHSMLLHKTMPAHARRSKRTNTMVKSRKKSIYNMTTSIKHPTEKIRSPTIQRYRSRRYWNN